jgi:hypothetical protein
MYFVQRAETSKNNLNNGTYTELKRFRAKNGNKNKEKN